MSTMPATPRPVRYYVAGWLAILSPFVFFAFAVGLVQLLLHYRHFQIDVLFLSPPLLVNAVFTYLRRFRPTRVPAPLEADSAERARLLHRKKLLNRIGYSSFALTFVVLFVGYAVLGDGNMTIDRTLYIIALPIIVAVVCIFWADGLAAYIKERAPEPQPRYLKRTVRPNSPIHSEHWGEPPAPLQQD